MFHNLNGLKQHSASKRQNLTAGKVNRIECCAGTTNFIFSIDLVSWAYQEIKFPPKVVSFMGSFDSVKRVYSFT